MKAWHISRRKALRGLGASVALPFLQAMIPPGVRAESFLEKNRIKRLAVFYFPNGVRQDLRRSGSAQTRCEFQEVRQQPLGARPIRAESMSSCQKTRKAQALGIVFAERGIQTRARHAALGLSLHDVWKDSADKCTVAISSRLRLQSPS